MAITYPHSQKQSQEFMWSHAWSAVSDGEDERECVSVCESFAVQSGTDENACHPDSTRWLKMAVSGYYESPFSNIIAPNRTLHT